MKVNYHTHTKRCKHAVGEDEEYVLAAIKGGFKVLGFSDHTPWAYKSDFVPRIRMTMDQFGEYCASIRALKEKYADKIEILLGVEAEYYPEYMDSFKQMLKDYKLDYAIFGNHFYPDDENGVYLGNATNQDEYLDRYVQNCIDGLETGLYSYLAHPDLFMRGRQIFDEKAREASYKICKYAKEHDVILEYNLEGARMSAENHNVFYPYPEFWKIASEIKNRVIIGVDAHDPYSLARHEYYDGAIKFLTELGLTIENELPRKF